MCLCLTLPPCFIETCFLKQYTNNLLLCFLYIKFQVHRGNVFMAYLIIKRELTANSKSFICLLLWSFN